MRILVIWLQGRLDHRIPAYTFWRPHWKGALEEAGHTCLEVPDVDWAKGLAEMSSDELGRWRTGAWERTVGYVRELHNQRSAIDLCLCYLAPRQVEGAAVRELRRLGIPCANFFCDNLRDFRRAPEAFRDFDLNWGPEPEAELMYRAAGMPYVFAPYPIWIPPPQRTAEHPETHGVTFIGSRDVQRAALLAGAIKLGTRMEIRGAGWTPEQHPDTPSTTSPATKARRQLALVQKEGASALLWKLTYLAHRPPSDDVFLPHVKPRPDAAQYVEVTQRAKIVLGINRYPSYRHAFWNPPTFIRLRDLEATAMGACYLTEYSPGLERWFELGLDIEVYRSPQELVARIDDLEKNPLKRKDMRRRAQQRVFQDLTMAKTLERLVKSLRLSIT